MARPIKHKLDEAMVLKLASNGNTYKDIATICGCCEDTLRRRYANVIERGKAQLRENLRAKQVQVAIDGANPQMLIWLGKQMLDQKDRQDVTSNDQTLVIKNIHGVSMDEI